MHAQLPNPDKPLTLLHGGALGDLVLALQFARRVFPDLTADGLHAISRVTLPELNALHPPIDSTSSEALAAHWLWSDGDDPPPAALRQQITDHPVLSFLGTGAEQKLRKLNPAALWTIDPVAPADQATHITAYWRSQLLPDRRTEPQRPLGFDAALLRDRATKQQAASDVLVQLGSGGRAKCWPIKQYVAVARRLGERGLNVQAIAGPVEAETWSPEDFVHAAQVGGVTVATDSGKLIDAIAHTRLLLGNDSGPSHLAALLNVPTVTLFGPTDARVWQPIGPHTRLIQGDPARGPDWGVAANLVTRTVLALLREQSPPAAKTQPPR
jgi:hypothetical protein